MATITIIVSAVDATGPAIGTAQAKLMGLQGAVSGVAGAAERDKAHGISFIDRLARIAAGVLVAVGFLTGLRLAMDGLVGQALAFNDQLNRIDALTNIT